MGITFIISFLSTKVVIYVMKGIVYVMKGPTIDCDSNYIFITAVAIDLGNYSILIL